MATALPAGTERSSTVETAAGSAPDKDDAALVRTLLVVHDTTPEAAVRSLVEEARANGWDITERVSPGRFYHLGTKRTPDVDMVLAIYYASETGDVVLRFYHPRGT